MICAFLCHLAVSAGRLDEAVVFHERGLRAGDALGQPLARADVLNAGYRIAEAAGDRALAIARLEEANALSIGVGDVTLRINYLFNLVVTLLNGGEVEAARARRAEVMALVRGMTDPRSRFIEDVSEARLAIFAGDLGNAWRALVRSAEAINALGAEPNMLRTVFLVQAQLLVAAGEPVLLAQVVEAIAATATHPPGRIVPIDAALRARVDLLRGDAAAVVARLAPALAADAPIASDPDRRENLELLRVTLAAAQAALGDEAGARISLQGIGFSPRLEAMAVEIALGLDDRPDRVEAAGTLLAGGRLAPLERVRLQRALAARHRRAGDAAAAAVASGEAARGLAALLATLNGDAVASTSLRGALERLAVG